MTKNYEIAEFQETDDLGPTATRKLNSNFRNMLLSLRDIKVGGVDTGAIASYVIDVLNDSIDTVDNRVDTIETWITEHGYDDDDDDTVGVIYYGKVDSGSQAKAMTATVPGLTELSDGTCVLIHNGVVTSASPFTLNINDLGAKPVYNARNDYLQYQLHDAVHICGR